MVLLLTRYDVGVIGNEVWWRCYWKRGMMEVRYDDGGVIGNTV